MVPVLAMTIAAAALLLARGCEVSHGDPAAERRFAEPARGGGPSLWGVVAARRSTRVFSSRPLAEAEVGQLLWAAQGSIEGRRTAPSAGALYPLTVRAVDARGVWRYQPDAHALVLEAPRDVRAALAVAALGQDSVRAAPITFVVSGAIPITAKKYGPRAERFVTLEAGHAAQNLLLAVTALDLAAVPVGAFDDVAVRDILALPARETPLYLIPVGNQP